MLRFESMSELETERFAADFAKRLKAGDVIAFRGGLGAGKTAFARGLAAGLGLDAGEVSSPTFALVHEYRNEAATLCHFDMYRINGYDALYSTGFFDYLDGGAILAVEWSENIEEFLPGDSIAVTLEQTGENSRLITVEGGGRF